MGFHLKVSQTLRWLRVSIIPTWVHLAHKISALRFEKRWLRKHQVGCRWSQLRKGACATEMCFSSSDFSDSSFHPGPNPRCLSWQDPLPFSCLYMRRSLKAMFIDTASHGKSNLFIWFEREKTRLLICTPWMFLSEESKNHRKREMGKGLWNCGD